MVSRKISWGFYALTLVVTVAIFMSGIYFGFFLNKAKENQLQGMILEMEKARSEQELNLLLMEYLPNKTCSAMGYEVEKMIPRINELEKQVTYYEENMKFGESSYMETKRDYMMSQIKYWLYMERLKSRCDLNVTTLLYFYSNRDCGPCRDQGIVLDYVKNGHSSDLMIFALDTDLGLNSIDMIMKSYGVSELPSIIVSGEIHGGFVNKTSIEGLVNQSQS